MTFGDMALRLSGIAARRLGWRPDDVWAATPAELIAALIPRDGAAPLDRPTFDRLMELDQDGR